MDDHICPICGESKDPRKARFVHVRLGLDEPPEPVLCKCKDAVKIMNSIHNKIESTTEIKNTIPSTTMDSLEEMNMHSSFIYNIASKPMRERELRVDTSLSKTMFEKMEKGLFENATTRRIRERSCIKWTGSDTNMNAKVRKRSNGEAVVKVLRSKVKVAPGYELVLSDEYPFSGIIVHAQSDVEMDEIRSVIKVRTCNVNVIARKYEVDDKVSFACEFEMEGKVTNSIVRAVLCMALGTVGTITSMRSQINPEFMNDIRKGDHAVIDVPSLDEYEGDRMAKADGMKVYVFCYDFGYVVTVTDPALTVLTCMAVVNSKDVPEMTNAPDVVLAEMMMNGEMIYIGTLAMDCDGRLPLNMHKFKCPITTEKPPLIYRTSWDRMPTKIELELEPTPNDGVVLTNKFRTMRLKQPTVDLIYTDGKLNAIDSGVLIPIVDGLQNMEVDTVYELDVIKEEDTDTIKLMRPRERALKKVPNNLDVVRRAIASATADTSLNAVLIDITSMSFDMRERTYLMAQARANKSKKVIVSFGVGRFQEWRQMLSDGFSYIAIDPNIDISDLTKRAKTLRVLPYDFSTNFNTQVVSISKGVQTILWAKCRSEDFVKKAMPTRVMVEKGIPAVFSFSISYHIPLINMLKTEGVMMFGCGFVHDSMSDTVGKEPVTMRLKDKHRRMSSEVVSTFGKSTWVEPFLKMSMVPGLVLVKNAMPDLWERVDSNTIEIMDRAVIMSSS